MDAEDLSPSVICCELMPLLSRFAEAVDHPYDLVDPLTDLLGPPRSWVIGLPGEAARPRDLASSLFAERVLYVRH